MDTKKQERSLSDLIDHILVRYHEPLKNELPLLLEMSQKLVRVHGDKHPELSEIEAALRGFSDQMLRHMHKEETVLFRMMRTLQDIYE